MLNMFNKLRGWGETLRTGALSVIVLLAISSPLSAETAQVPLANRIIAADGDMKNVLIWRWLNELTQDNAAVVLTTTGDLSQISLPRSWRKGQTVGQVIRGAEIFLGRFRVHFEGKTLTLISMTADEMMTNKAYKETARVRDWEEDAGPGSIRSELELYSGLMTTGDTYNSSQTLLAFGAGYSFRLADTWLAGYLRLEGGFGEAEYSQLSFSVAKANLQAGVRWLPFNSWVISPYLQAGLLYSIYAEYGREMLVPTETYYQDDYLLWGGLGLAGSLGLRGNLADGFTVFLEYGRSVTFLSSGSLELGEFRFGLTVGL